MLTERVYGIHKPTKSKFERRKVIVPKHNVQYQADLVDLTKLQKKNSGYKWMLNVIDAFSRFAYSIPQKTKNGPETARNFEKILKNGPSIRLLQTDRDKCFLSKDFRAVLKKYNVKLFHTDTELKASICERYNRTILEKLFRYMTATGVQRWINVLPILVKTYNDTVHSTIGMAPSQVTNDNYEEVFNKIHEYRGNSSKKTQKKSLEKGTYVRISRLKNVFTKGYLPRWSHEIYKVDKVLTGQPVVYKLRDLQGKSIVGIFYREELQPVIFKGETEEFFAIDKILRKTKNKLFVSWLGYPPSFNSWIKKSDLRNISHA